MFSESVGKLYKNHVVIGNGSCGKVFCAQRVTDSRTVAVKEIDTASADITERGVILSEYTFHPKILDPNIVTCYTTYFDEDSSQLYLEMEFCPGGSLADIIKRQRVKKQPLPEREVWKIFKEVASALVYLHSSANKPSIGPIIHRDIKPANIVFSSDGVAKICDFGLSRGLNAMSLASSRVGTDLYLAPEVDQGEYNEKVDVWSLGCVMLELCTLRKPKPCDPIILGTYSSQLAAILRSCLTMPPSERLSSAKLLQLLINSETQALSRKPSSYYELSDNDDEEEDAGDRELRERKEKLRAQATQEKSNTEVESLVFFGQELDMSTMSTMALPEQDDKQPPNLSVVHTLSVLTEESTTKQQKSTIEQLDETRALLQKYISALESRDNEIAHLKAILATQAQPASLAALRPSTDTLGFTADDIRTGSVDFAVKEPSQFTTYTTTEKESTCLSPRSFDHSLGIVFEDLIANQHRTRDNPEIETLRRSIQSRDAIIEELRKQTDMSVHGTKTFLDALNRDIKTLENELREKDILIEELCETIDKKNSILDSVKRKVSISILSDGSFTDKSKSATPENTQLRRGSPYNTIILEKDQQIQHLRDELVKQQTHNVVLRDQKIQEQECIIQDLSSSLHTANAEIAMLRQMLDSQSSLDVSGSYSRTPGTIQMPSLELSQHFTRINELEQANRLLIDDLAERDAQIEDLIEAMVHQEISLSKMREATMAQRMEVRKLEDAVRAQTDTISMLTQRWSPQSSPDVSPTK